MPSEHESLSSLSSRSASCLSPSTCTSSALSPSTPLTLLLVPPRSTSPSYNSQFEEILFLLDKFGVSDKFYHELSMIHPSLPRSYQVKRTREQISANVEIKRLLVPYFGCYRPFEKCLFEALSTKV